MKKFTLLFLFFSLAVSAQESFPYKRPQLLLNKTVKISLNEYQIERGADNFYADSLLQDTYKPHHKNSRLSPSESLIGREFTVIAVDSVINKYTKQPGCRFMLKDTADEVLYYKYDISIIGAFDFPFEVVGGLDVPEGFYCDYVEKEKYTSDAYAYVALIDAGMFFRRKMNYEKVIEYSMSFVIYSDYKVDGKIDEISLIMENDKTIKQMQSIYAMPAYKGQSKYEFLMIFDQKEMQRIMNNKILGIKIKDKVIPFKYGEKLLNISKCMFNLPLAKK